MYMCAHGVCVHSCVRAWRPEVSLHNCSLGHCVPCHLRQGFSPFTWSLLIALDCLASKLQDSPISSSSALGITTVHHHAWLFHVGSREPNVGPQACMANALLPKLSLQPWGREELLMWGGCRNTCLPQSIFPVLNGAKGPSRSRRSSGHDGCGSCVKCLLTSHRAST